MFDHDTMPEMHNKFFRNYHLLFSGPVENIFIYYIKLLSNAQNEFCHKFIQILPHEFVRQVPKFEKRFRVKVGVILLPLYWRQLSDRLCVFSVQLEGFNLSQNCAV